jgi:hypothetical protein
MTADPEAARVAAIAAGLTRGQREFLTGRHTEEGNPWPFIGMRQRGGGAKDRMFKVLVALGLYDRGNCLTPLGLAVRQHLQDSPDAL